MRFSHVPSTLEHKKSECRSRGYRLKLHAVIELWITIFFSLSRGRCPPLTIPSVALPFTFYLSWSHTNSLWSNNFVRLDFWAFHYGFFYIDYEINYDLREIWWNMSIRFCKIVVKYCYFWPVHYGFFYIDYDANCDFRKICKEPSGCSKESYFG